MGRVPFSWGAGSRNIFFFGGVQWGAAECLPRCRLCIRAQGAGEAPVLFSFVCLLLRPELLAGRKRASRRQQACQEAHRENLSGKKGRPTFCRVGAGRRHEALSRHNLQGQVSNRIVLVSNSAEREGGTSRGGCGRGELCGTN